MLEKKIIQVISVKMTIEENNFIVTIDIKNPANRTLYAYGSLRRIIYDNATRVLNLYLHDQGMPKETEEVLSPHFKEPHFVPLESNAMTEIKLRLNPIVNRIRSATERRNGPVFEELYVTEATEVNVEIAHQDTPFYYNPKIENLKQFKEWGVMISKGSFKVSPIKTSTG